MYGHSDPVHAMKMSPSNGLIASCDTFGKIKICEFPNVFNLITTLLYKNE
jgi:hypothetical protein